MKKMIFEKLICRLYGHDFTYERWNSVIVRSCNRCIKTQSGIYVEEPELCSTSKTDWKKVIETVKWRDV